MKRKAWELRAGRSNLVTNQVHLVRPTSLEDASQWLRASQTSARAPK
ncbi:hypothetical protein [Caballeronia sp. KNU42]